MRLIPAIDIINGQCVRLTQGDYAKKKVYSERPILIARELEAQGYEYLHLVDLDGAKSSSPKNLHILNQLAIETNLIIDFGGGIKSEDNLVQSLRSGATQVNVGSLAVRNPNLVKFWILRYGSRQIVIGADVKDEMISINGWREDTKVHIFDFIGDFVDSGAKYFVCTDISRDGMMQGAAIDLYRQILKKFPKVKLIASGGISSIDECLELKDLGLDGAILGKGLLEGLIDSEELIKRVS